MKRQLLRLGMAVLLVAVTVLAGLMWMSGYEKSPDPGARFKIRAVQLKSDRSYVWLKIHVEHNGKEQHDLTKPVRLMTGDGLAREPDTIEFAGSPQQGFTDIWYAFWMEQRDLKGKIVLKINDGALRVKESEQLPALSEGGIRVFKKSNWERSWLGF